VYAVEVSDQIMIATLPRGRFRPAQKVHGATFVIRVAFLADELDAHGIVVDIARATRLKEALLPLNYRNLDELPQFKGVNTTTEFLTSYLFDHLANAARAATRPRRPRAQIDPRDRRRIPACARLVRGGVVVREAFFAVPGDLATPTGGYAYDGGSSPSFRRSVGAWSRQPWGRISVSRGRYPRHGLRTTCGAAARSSRRDRRPRLRCLPEAAEALRASHPLVALVHHPLALESG